jgi:hypothetical protein
VRAVSGTLTVEYTQVSPGGDDVAGQDVIPTEIVTIRSGMSRLYAITLAGTVVQTTDTTAQLGILRTRPHRTDQQLLPADPAHVPINCGTRALACNLYRRLPVSGDRRHSPAREYG